MGLKQEILSQAVSTLPISPGVVLRADVPVRDAVVAMRQAKQGCVVVVDEKGRPEGKFTEHQMARLLIEEPDFLDKPVGKYIREYWAQIRRTEPIATLIHKLQTYRQRHVIVVDEDGKVLGVVGQKGLMVYLSEQFPRLVKVQSMDTKVAMNDKEGA